LAERYLFAPPPGQVNLLASGILALPDDATVLIRIGAALGGEAEHGARLVQADEPLELGVIGSSMRVSTRPVVTAPASEPTPAWTKTCVERLMAISRS